MNRKMKPAPPATRVRRPLSKVARCERGWSSSWPMAASQQGTSSALRVIPAPGLDSQSEGRRRLLELLDGDVPELHEAGRPGPLAGVGIKAAMVLEGYGALLGNAGQLRVGDDFLAVELH